MTRSQRAWSTPLRMVDVDAEALGPEQLDGEHFRARNPLLDSPRQLLLELPLGFVCTPSIFPPTVIKMGAARPFRQDR